MAVDLKKKWCGNGGRDRKRKVEGAWPGVHEISNRGDTPSNDYFTGSIGVDFHRVQQALQTSKKKKGVGGKPEPKKKGKKKKLQKRAHPAIPLNLSPSG